MYMADIASLNKNVCSGLKSSDSFNKKFSQNHKNERHISKIGRQHVYSIGNGIV